MKVIPPQETNPCRAFRRRLGGRINRFLVLAACFLSLMGDPAARADDVFDCTEDSLRVALASGIATFTEDCEILLTDTILIDADFMMDTQGHNVTINGQNLVSLFSITNASFQAFGISFINGRSETNGGALYIDEDSTVVLSNCTFSGNVAIGTNGLNGANGADSDSGNGGNGGNGRPGDRAVGGAIFSLGSLELYNCTISSNSAAGGDGGSGGNGGSS